jgi:tetratricopeptide (TPR) repeat protein
LEKATAADANSATAWSYLAEARRGLNDLDGARRAAEKAVVLRPDASGPRLLLALILARAGRAPDAARREFERAVALGPQQAVIHREYARWLLDSGNAPNDAQLAEAEASRAVALNRDDADAYLVLGRGQMRNNKRDAAITALTRAAALAPYDPAPALALRQAYHQIGNAARARHWERAYLVRQKQATRYTTLFDAVRADPQAPGPRQRFARLLAERGDVNGCIRHHAAALRSALDAPAALIAAANDLSDTGHASDALPLATRAAQISRASPAAHEALGNALLGLGRAHEAALEYDKAVGFRPHRYADLRAKVERFWAERDRNPPPAEQAYRAALTLEHTQVGPRTLTPEGETLARKAVELEPTNLDYLRYLLRVQIGLRKTEAAVETANRLLSHFPKDAETHARLGVFLADRATRPDELAAAQEHLNQTKTSSSPAVAATRHYGLGLLALKRGQGALAARELRESARLDPDADVTFYKLALAERMAKNPTAAQQAMTVFRTRQNRKRAQMKVLGDIALHPDRPALYERAATLFVEQGLPEQAAAIRAEARRRFGSDKKQQTSLPPRKVSAR